MVDILHINDNALLLELANPQLEQSGNGHEQIVTQGYAWFKGDSIHFDLASNADEIAVKHCRLAPQQINNRYWMQCDQSTISENSAGLRHAADLIWQHLGQLKQRFDLNELILVTPSHYRAENLQLLLGVAKACGLNVKALINKSVMALSASKVSDGDYLHHDVQLHQTVSSQLSVTNGMVSLGEVEVKQDLGIHLMQEALLKGLQNSFIQSDRFDPLHNAATEQQLFDQLAALAEQLASAGKATVALEYQGKLHSASLDAKMWNSWLSDATDRLQGANSQSVLLDLNFAFGSAGLTALDDLGMTTISGAPLGIAKNYELSDSQTERVVYQTDLPVIDPHTSLEKPVVGKLVDAVDNSEKAVESGFATHLLSAGRAIAISQAQVSLQGDSLSIQKVASGNALELLNSGQLFVMNDEGRTNLQPNDRLGSQLIDGVITVIQLV